VWKLGTGNQKHVEVKALIYIPLSHLSRRSGHQELDLCVCVCVCVHMHMYMYVRACEKDGINQILVGG
jgi:hypothetical protein